MVPRGALELLRRFRKASEHIIVAPGLKFPILSSLYLMPSSPAVRDRNYLGHLYADACDAYSMPSIPGPPSICNKRSYVAICPRDRPIQHLPNRLEYCTRFILSQISNHIIEI